MPWQNNKYIPSNGVSTPGNTIWSQSASAGRAISSAEFDEFARDLAAVASGFLRRDGSNGISGNVDLAGNKFTNVGVAVARNQYLTLGQAQDAVVNGVPDSGVGGTANEVILTPQTTFDALRASMFFVFRVGTTNTGPVTVDVGNHGAKSVLVGTNELEAGDWDAGAIVMIVYDGTNFQTTRLSEIAVHSQALASNDEPWVASKVGIQLTQAAYNALASRSDELLYFTE